MENKEKLSDWVAHLRSAQPLLTPALQARVLAYRAAMGAAVGNRLLADMGMRPIPRRVSKSGPATIQKLCRRLIKEQGEFRELMVIGGLYCVFCSTHCVVRDCLLVLNNKSSQRALFDHYSAV